MKKVCIFCRKPKDKFVPEHVFPAAIGGAFIILNVCEVCNEKLGEGIDTSLSNNRIVLFYRKQFNVGREGVFGKRNIRNPFKKTGHHLDEDGNEHYVSFNEDKKEFEPTMVRKYEELRQAEEGWIGKLTIPLKDFTNEEDIKKQYAKKFGINTADIERIEKQINPQKTVTLNLSDSNRTFFLGCLKIAYEFAMTFIPGYIDDPFSKEFADILLTNSVKEEQKAYFNYDTDLRKEFTKRIGDIENLQPYHHVAMLTTIEGKGLYCVVKIFGWIYAIRLSKREDFLKTKKLLIINDSVQQTFEINIPTKLSNFNITLDLADLNRIQRRTIQKSAGVGYKTAKGNIPVFDKDGKVNHKHIEELAANLQILPQHYHHFDKKIIVPVGYKKGTHHVKLLKENLLIPIRQVDYVYDLLY